MRLYIDETGSIADSFGAQVEQRAKAFEREVLLNLEILHTLQAGLSIIPEVNRKTFDEMTRSVLDRSVVIQAFAWAPWVSRSSKDVFELQQQSWYDSFQLLELDAQGDIRPVSERPWYVPVQYIEPLASNQAAVGFDLASESNRLAALKQARDSGEMVATAAIRLVQETGQQKGFLVFNPLYRGKPETREERRKAHYAYVNGVFRIGDLFNQAVDPEIANRILFRVLDRTNGEEILLHQSANADDERWNTRFRHVTALDDIAGRQWQFEGVPSEAYISSRRGYLPWLVFVVGVLFVAISVAYSLLTLRRNSELQKSEERLKKVSLTDSLTGLANRRHFDRHLRQEWARARREKTSIALVLIDIDFFKPYNDEFGHPAGDECLRLVADALKNMPQRPADLVARYGGEEFALILPQTENASEVAEACRAAVEGLAIPPASESTMHSVTISAGVCTIIPQADRTPENLTQNADRALYKAKKEGRNRVFIY
ncbi:sensor domain-containing diguanylate cyclase [Marinobacter fonticola]|uniref:sensor domain-containing diguanylate cyclase n=1 Tax=Marinobacter fonticola TaxID=2603215 RepID=UPI00143D7125|nr:diguanylate cyclase [Marinobacter fonticola]